MIKKQRNLKRKLQQKRKNKKKGKQNNMDDFLELEYINKFKFVIMLTLLDLNTTEKRSQLIKDFKYNLINKTNPELRELFKDKLNQVAYDFKHIAPYKY